MSRLTVICPGDTARERYALTLEYALKDHPTRVLTTLSAPLHHQPILFAAQQALHEGRPVNVFTSSPALKDEKTIVQTLCDVKQSKSMQKLEDEKIKLFNIFYADKIMR